MNWHSCYAQQATWTRDLRAYLFNKAGLGNESRVLEVGCGTGAILSEVAAPLSLHGMDLDPAALAECKIHAPAASLIRADALSLPYTDRSFDIVYCHFLLLWVRDPLQALLEMKRITRSGGNIIAFAEPDYSNRIDKPKELVRVGKWQTESLVNQGADPGLGMRLAELFFQAGITLIETGTIQSVRKDPNVMERAMEWAVIEADLAGTIPDAEIQKMKRLDERAWEYGERVLDIPTYFAWGQI